MRIKRCVLALTFLLPVGLQAAERPNRADEWLDQSLRAQRDLERFEPIGRTSFLATHNSFNSKSYATAVRYWDPNQRLRISEQLNLGIRAIEFDVHYTVAGFKKDLLLCHGTSKHLGCSPFDLRFDDGLMEVSEWIRRPQNRREVIILYIEDHIDGQYAKALRSLNRYLGDLIYRPRGCETLPMTISRADILATEKKILVIGGDCQDLWATAVFTYQFPTENTLQPFPRCRTEHYDAEYLNVNLVRMYEDLTKLSEIFGAPSAPMTPAIVAQAVACNLGVVGLDRLIPGDPRLLAAVWSWDVREPQGSNPGRNADCAYQNPNGRFSNADCDEEKSFACASTGYAEWAVTTGKGPWQGGDQLCEDEFGPTYHFDVPKNGRQNQLLVSAKRLAAELGVWLNYSDRDQNYMWQ